MLRRLAADTDIASVIAAAPVNDTIKEANISRRVLRTTERSRMWAVQTPQAFRSESLRDAVAAHPDDLGTITDDAQLIEREGGEVLIQEASAENLKITTQLDLRIAEMLLAERRRASRGPPAPKAKASENVGKGWIVSRSRSSGTPARTASVACPIQSPVSGPTA